MINIITVSTIIFIIILIAITITINMIVCTIMTIIVITNIIIAVVIIIIIRPLDCRVLNPPEAWNGLARNPPSLGFEPRDRYIDR